MAVLSGIRRISGVRQWPLIEGSTDKSIIKTFSKWAVGIFSLTLLPGFLAACGSSREPTGSHIKQLGDRDFPCNNYSSDQIGYALRGMPEGFIDEGSFTVGKVDRVKNHLTGIPRPYLEWLFAVRKENGFRIAERNLGPGTMGVTVRGAASLIPLSVDLTKREDAVDFALKHEIGHALEARVIELNNSFAASFSRAFTNERNNRNLRAYARSRATEYFAEAFANFYCSKDAQEFIASNLPETYAILKASFIPASSESVSPEVVAQDTWMQLVDDRNQTFLEVSFPTGVRKAVLCRGSKDECTKTPSTFAALTSSPTKISGRSVFRSESEIKIEADLKLTVLVYDESDKAHAVKTVEFLEVGGP